MIVSDNETLEDSKARKSLESSYNSTEFKLTPEQEEFINTKFSSKVWRLDSLYTIQDKDGVKKILNLNESQKKVLLKYKHNRKVILKSRQQGISTLFLAYYLDSCLTKPGFQAGIQSYGQDEADKLSKRAELMWEELDQNIKDLLSLTLVSNNAKGMTFSNGSILKIGNFRGDTLQGLHVSELGKIAKKYPEKAKELKTGAFQAVSVNNKITVESTAEGRTGLFYDMWQKATTRVASTRGLTSLDFEPIFLSWIEDPDCQLFQEFPVSDEVKRYIYGYMDGDTKILGVEDELDIKLTDSQIWWLAAKIDELGDDFDQEYPATPDKAFASNIEGMYFKKQYNRLQKSSRITLAPYNPEYGVSVSFDLGINDETVMLFAQTVEGIPYLIDEYAGTDEGIVFYANVLKEMKYVNNYKEFIFPHDIMVRDYSTGRTRLETFQREGFSRCRVLEKLSFSDSIEAARQFIDVAVFDDSCINTLLALQNYRKKYDKRLGVFLGTDEHDIHSNYAASLRYMAQGLSYHRVTNSRTKSPEEIWARQQSSYNIGFAI
mgnify:CR=1 FL=1